jgi:WD40 repeat protein
VRAMCAVPAGGTTLLATASEDGTVRLWDPQTGNCVVTVPVHHAALAVAAVDDSLAIGLDAGTLLIKPAPSPDPRQASTSQARRTTAG